MLAHKTMQMSRFYRSVCAVHQLPPKFIFGDETIKLMYGKHELPSKLTDEQMEELKIYNAVARYRPLWPSEYALVRELENKS